MQLTITFLHELPIIYMQTPDTFHGQIKCIKKNFMEPIQQFQMDDEFD